MSDLVRTAVGVAGTLAVLATGAAPPQPPPAPADPSECATTAAERYGWGEPTRRSDFSAGLPGDWHPYGPEPGHDEQGIRTPEAITVADGTVTISATQDGTTGAMSWHPGQRYGRWEACVRSELARGGLNALLLLWPVAEDFPVGGEIDWMEIVADDRSETDFFLHHGPDNDQEHGSVRHDSTRWSAYALEWTPQKITAYVDGEEWYSTTDTEKFPPRPMNMTMQLDYFPPAGGPTAMHMDWARQWALPESEPAELSLAPGDPATGQPEDYPERAPRRLRPGGAGPPAGDATLVRTGTAVAVRSPAVATAQAPVFGHYQVDPVDGDDNGTGSVLQPFRTISRALAVAESGATVFLRPGTYDEHVVTVRPGVTVLGPRGAVLRGAASSGRVLEVRHDDTTLSGFTIDGRICAELVESCYRDKAIWVQSTVPHDGVTGTRILGMRLTNLGGECVRIKYFSTGSLVVGNAIGPCGIYDFAVPDTGTGQNGEGIYIGTAPEQLDRNPTPEPDASNDNEVQDNVIDTQGAECVDIKEAARDNDVAHNTCTGQHPRNGNSGAMDSRGPFNTFRSNHIHHNAAAGVRIGGDLPGDAVGNDVYDNVITDNARGGIKVEEFGPHGRICGNVMRDNKGGNAVGTYRARIGDPTAPC